MRRLMHRSAAAALLAWVNFTLIFAAFSPAMAADSNLPACCRRAGKHACMLAQSPLSGPALQAARCPMYPRSGAVPAQARATGLATSASIIAAVTSHPAAGPQTEARYRMSYSRAGQKRGPPVSLA